MLEPTLIETLDAIKTSLLQVVVNVPFQDTEIDEEFFNLHSNKLRKEGRVHFYNFSVQPIEETESNQRGRYVAIFDIEVHAFYERRSAEEHSKTFRDLLTELEQVRDNFRQNSTIFGAPERFQESVRTAQLTKIPELAQLGDVTGWHGVISLRIESVEVKEI